MLTFVTVASDLPLTINEQETATDMALKFPQFYESIPGMKISFQK